MNDAQTISNVPAPHPKDLFGVRKLVSPSLSHSSLNESKPHQLEDTITKWLNSLDTVSVCQTLECMHLTFVPVEEFYFALTLAVRTLEEISIPDLADKIGDRLQQELGQSSTVAAASQNTYNYVFRVSGIDNSPNPQLILSVSDWQGNLRISSDFGWTLNEERKPIRTDKFEQRQEFAQQIKDYLQGWLGIPLK